MHERADHGGAPRVGILIASLRLGGAERAALGLLAAMRAAGTEAVLLTLDGNRDMLRTLDDEQSEALSPHIVALGRGDIERGTVAKVLDGPRQWIALRREVRRRRIDVLISVMERANIINLATTGPVRHVLSVRSYPSKLFASKTALKRSLVLWLYRKLLRRADRLVFVSREAAIDFERIFPEIAGRSTVIYNACDVDRLRRLSRVPLPEGHEASVSDADVIAFGRLNPEKGHWALVRAFAHIAAGHPGSRLVILGSGPLGEGLGALARALGIADRVVLPGMQGNPAAWIGRARLYVLPSVWEGFPNALLEALAVGIPVVSADCHSGPRELLVPESDPTAKTAGIEETPYGFLVPPPDGRCRPASEPLTEDERLLAEAMERLLDEDGSVAARRAEAARRRADAFKPDEVLPRWAEVIEESG